MDKNRECSVKDGVKIICPDCGAIITVPMCKAVNGETIGCEKCGKEFIFKA